MKEITGYSGDSYWIDNEEIQATEEQQKILSELIDIDYDPPEDENLHALRHSAPEYEKGMGGYVYGEILEKWAADKPQVKVFHFDDTMFMSSIGFIVPSSSKYEHMGLSVILCPQAGDVMEFFLYTGHAGTMLRALTEAIKESGKFPRINNNKPSRAIKERLKEKLLELQK
jgi:hypothetical protein